MTAYLVLLLALNIFSLAAGQATITNSDFELNTALGNVTGIEINRTGTIYYSFYGIPYAKPPLGPLRFAKPEPFGNFINHDGTVVANRCHGMPLIDISEPNEDCLFINIQTRLNGTVKRPVLVWIHGGGYITGSANEYPGDAFVTRKDFVFVAMNYRLGYLGFPPVETDANINANLGLWDQHLALKWVRDNIGDYGGDNESITIFGESAGGGSVVSQMMSPHNDRSVFQRVVAQSHNFPTYNLLPPKPVSFQHFTSIVGCNKTNLNATGQMDCLRQLDVQFLGNLSLSHPEAEATVYLDDPFFNPNLLHDIAKTLEDPTGETKPDNIQHIGQYDLIAGWNNDEGHILLPYIASSFTTINGSTGVSREAMKNLMKTMTMLRSVRSKKVQDFMTDAIIAGYNHDISLERGMELAGKSQEEINIDIFKRFGGDTLFNIPGSQIVKLHYILRTNTKTYGYLFTYKPVQKLWSQADIAPEWTQVGATHGEDLIYIFGLPKLKDIGELNLTGLGSFLDLAKNNSFLESEKKLSDAFVDYWTEFASTGMPTTTASLREWPEYNDSQTYALIGINETKPIQRPGEISLTLVTALNKAERMSIDITTPVSLVDDPTSLPPSSPSSPPSFTSKTTMSGATVKPGDLKSPLPPDQMYIVMIVVPCIVGVLWIITLICCIKARRDASRLKKNLKKYGADNIGM